MATSTFYITPNSSLVPETVKLSLIDQFTLRVYVPTLLFFKFDANTQPNVISDLKSGLASLLDELPLLAGTVVVEDEDSGTLEVDIPEDAKVLFKVREMVDAKKGPTLDFSELEKASFPSSQLDPSILSPIGFIPGAIAPVLAIQVNIIRGGIILAFYANHNVFDGTGAAKVLVQWSKHVTAVSENRILSQSDVFPYEAFDRSVLLQGIGSTLKLSDFPGFEIRRPAGTYQPDHIQTALPEFSAACWYISKGNLQALQVSAQSPTQTSKFTESNILCAFLWQHYSRARQLDGRVEYVSFFTPCDARARTDPPLHPDYLGNAVVHSKARVHIDELYSDDPEAMGRIASQINDSVNWYSSDIIWKLLGAMETERLDGVERSMDVTCKIDLEITNNSSFPLYDGHWGTLGTPNVFRMPGIYGPDGQVAILPRLPDGGLELITFIDGTGLDLLKGDAGFLKYAQLRW